VREDAREEVERDALVSRGNHDVEDRPNAGGSRRGVQVAEPPAVDRRENEVAADVERVGILDKGSVDVGDSKSAFAPSVCTKRRSSPMTVRATVCDVP
jgi:hypothetical protein